MLVHGSNFGIYTENGTTIKCAKRTGFISPTERFFNYQYCVDKLKSKIKTAYDVLKTEFPDMKRLIIYGELFGGCYPHEKVEPVEGLQFVQKGIWYSPSLEFYAFDIKVVTTKSKGGMLDYDHAEKIFKKAGFLYAEPLKIGTLKELLEYNVENMVSWIPERLGLPLIKSNYAEGIVLKPIKTSYLPTGSRVILKKKAKFMSEVNPPKQKPKKKKKETKQNTNVKLSKECQELRENATRYVSENRLRGCISKIGQVSLGKEMAKLLGMLAKDAIEDFKKDFKEKFEKLEPKEQKVITKAVSDAAKIMIHKYGAQISGGEF